MGNEEKNQNASNNTIPKGKITLFLERNEIWFKTVLSLTLTIAAFAVSLASFSNSKIQLDRQNQEKTAFFTIENIYDAESKQFIYVIKNTGGEARRCSVTISPFLYVSQEKRTARHVDAVPLSIEQTVSNPILNEAFIYLPSFYTPIDPSNYTNAVFAFSDIWIEDLDEYLYVADDFSVYPITPDPKLADDYFRKLVSDNNIDSLQTRMQSELIYYVKIYYTNYENQSLDEALWLRRSADDYAHSIGQNGNCVLSYDYNKSFVEKNYYSAQKKGNCYIVDSLNLPIDMIIDETKQIIEELFIKFDQLRNSITPDS